LEFVM